MGRKVERNRNGGKWTEAQYWSAIRSTLRRGFRYWGPIINCKLASRRPYEGEDKRQKWEFLCNSCGGWFKDRDIQVDHIIPTGTLRSLTDVPGFIERLTPEEGFQVLCKPCHKRKTDDERKCRNNEKV